MRAHIALVAVTLSVLLGTSVLWCSYQMLSPEESSDFGWTTAFRHEMSVASNDRLLRQETARAPANATSE
ncbi:hypothetical protein SDRG_10266 [Saprolegnia diclina VS20]|uniref:Uncharacterized protein n=1 Tax=Saprolegnia diclina (strain VS20) TaxID=1156394 RepID=T0Q2L0_SAPDV|nr:hypothetical protein SDRG_10266 [Saprolegnia diclina VS20]EQC32069.1 hypothetical protein SDRG_10266 [Saprolegnia diclina VS20]|eukprot:XP_008614471.1 hypothetical protein SDRG_10266 [Saprolegnia diclina VS20]